MHNILYIYSMYMYVCVWIHVLYIHTISSYSFLHKPNWDKGRHICLSELPETVIAGQPDTNTGTMTQVWLKIPCFIVAYHHVPSEKAKVGDRHTRAHIYIYIYIIYVYVYVYIYMCVYRTLCTCIIFIYIYICDIPNCQTHPNGCWENLPKQKTKTS